MHAFLFLFFSFKDSLLLNDSTCIYKQKQTLPFSEILIFFRLVGQKKMYSLKARISNTEDHHNLPGKPPFGREQGAVLILEVPKISYKSRGDSEVKPTVLDNSQSLKELRC